LTGPTDVEPPRVNVSIVRSGDGDQTFSVFSESGSRLLSSVPLTWESEFFGRSMRRVDLVAPVHAASMAEWLGGVDATLAEHDGLGVAITQMNLDFESFQLLCLLERRGFRSVDTRAAFVTLISPERTPDRTPPFGAVEDLGSAHLDEVLALVRTGFSRNSRFQSRFKNPDWFTQADADRYFEAWIRNTVDAPGALGAVWIHEGQTLGFFLYQRLEDRGGIPQYKGILAAVRPEHQGNSAHLFLQSYLYTRMPDRVWLDNTTQLTNTAAIRNHMESGKRLDALSIILYRSGVDGSEAV
jgi:hypothetical protein